MKITLPQQSLNLLRAYLSQPGWAKTLKEIYLGGKLLAETLPTPDISWIKGEKALDAMTVEERQIYNAADVAWCAVTVDVELTDNERDVCKKALEKLVEAGALGASKWLFKLLESFGIKPE